MRKNLHSISQEPYFIWSFVVHNCKMKTFLLMISLILLPVLILLLSILSVTRHLICGNNLNWLLNLNLIYKTLDWDKKWLVDFITGKIQLVSSDWSNNNGSIDAKMDESVLKKKSSFKKLWLTFPSELDWGSYIISIAKTASKKIGILICSLKFLSPEIALYLYKSTICPWMEYCCHVWAGVPSCSLELLDKLQKWISRTVVSSLAASHEPLSHCRNMASLSHFYRYYFGRCFSELAQLVPLPFSRGRSAHCFDRLHDFSVTIPRYYKDV